MALATHSEVNFWPTYYEPTGAAASFQYDPTFYSRLEAWASYHYIHSPVSWLNPGKLYSYGAYVNKPGAHGSGRAFDLSRLYLTVNGASTPVCSARYDIWRTYTGSTLTTYRKRYWGTAAGIFRHFQYVLTYLYDTDHWNHIHIDNLVSGSGNSVFSTSSTTQVQFVQASLVYVWGYTAVSIDGAYGPQTSDYASRALDRSGSTGSLTALANWQRFCETTLRFGTGRQSY